MPNSAKISSIRLCPGFILIWIPCDPTDFGRFSVNGRCEESRKRPGKEKPFTIHVSNKLCASHHIQDLCYNGPGTIYWLTRHTYTQIYMEIYRYRCIHTQMYGERQRGRERPRSEILLHLKSVQNLFLNFFHTFVFPRALSITLATQSARHCTSAGAALSSTAGILNI